MKNKSILLTLLIVSGVLVVYAIAAPPVQQARQNVTQASGWEYAQLIVINDDEMTWLVGGDQPERVRPLRGLLGDLGGNGRPTLANLLDQIGSRGWELTFVENSTWTFKRPIR